VPWALLSEEALLEFAVETLEFQAESSKFRERPMEKSKELGKEELVSACGLTAGEIDFDLEGSCAVGARK